MKTISLLIANIASSAVLADLMSYIQDRDVIRLIIGLGIIAVVSYFVWSHAENEHGGWYYVFTGSVLMIMDAMILAQDASMLSFVGEVVLLTVLNAFVFWVMNDICTPPADSNNRPPQGNSE